MFFGFVTAGYATFLTIVLGYVNNYWAIVAKLNLFLKHKSITWPLISNNAYLKTKCPVKGLHQKNKTYHGNNKWNYCVFSKNKN